MSYGTLWNQMSVCCGIVSTEEPTVVVRPIHSYQALPLRPATTTATASSGTLIRLPMGHLYIFLMNLKEGTWRKRM